MKRKGIVLVLTLLLLLSAIVILPNNFDTEAGSGEKEGEGIEGLDYDYMWDVTLNLSNVVHNYPSGLIPKGRAFGSWGCENETSEYLFLQMKNYLGLEGVSKIKMGPVADKPGSFYTTHIEVNDYQLIINHPDYSSETGWASNVPITEIFPVPSGLKNTITGDLTYNYTFDEVKLLSASSFGDLWPLGGNLTGDYLNVSCESANNYNIVIGNVTYLNSSDNMPEEQEGMIFMFDEEEGCEEKLENVTNSTSIVLIHDSSRGHFVTNMTNYTVSIARVYSNDNNITEIKNMLKNGTMMVADNALNNDTITFTYNLTQADLPNHDYVLVDKFPPTFNWRYKSIIMWVMNQLFPSNKCLGYVYFSQYEDDAHYMTWYNRNWWRLAFPFPGLTIFQVNNSVGNWLKNHSGETDNTISGYIDQEYTSEQHTPILDPSQWTSGIDAYLVVGHINISESPDDKIVIISNRHDGWWGETPGDSGAGCGIVLGIAKYLKDNNIKPKYNITFLQTTAEEMGFRGAQYYSDTHLSDNIIMWIGADQLGFDQPNTELEVLFKNSETREIAWAITNETNYFERSGYEINHIVTWPTDNPLLGTAAEDLVFQQRGIINQSVTPCDTICICKNGNWTNHHRTGLEFLEGDSLKNTDRNDLNVTFEMFWNITKYFVVNPDCWFENISYTGFDQENDGDQLPDSIKATYNIRTILPEDLIMINASLINIETAEIVENEKYNFTVSSDGTNGNITVKLPDKNKKGFYRLYLDLYNSTGRINEIVGIGGNNINISDNSSVFQLFTPFGYTNEGESSESVHNYIRGSNFTMHENGMANNVTAYIRTDKIIYPGPTYKCLIYRENDWALMGVTEEKNFPDDTDPIMNWVTFNFSSPPELERNTNYILCCWGKNSQTYMGYDSASSRGFFDLRNWLLPAPDPADFTSENKLYSIYCDYTFAIPLSVGWNLITIPIENNWYASDLADSITSCNSVSVWDAVNQTYKTYIVGGPPSFDFQLTDGYGYFVDVDSENIFTMDGAIITSVSVPLEIGWNLIGWFHTYETSAYSLSDNITDCTSVSKWDAVNQTYKTYIVGGPPTFDFTIYRGMGLFADVTSESTWGGEGGYGSPPDEGDGDGGGDNGSSPGLPYLIYGRAFYGNTSIPAIDAGVTITNENTSEEIFTTVNIDEFWYYKYLDDFSSGWSDGDEITVSISGIDMYSNWEGKAEIIANESMGCQQVEDIILTGESVVIRYDNGTMENDTHLEDSSDQAIKTINIDSSVLENATSISLWTYGQGYGEKYVSGNTHSITVNGNGSQVIYFNPIDKFGLNYSWQSFDVNISWLNAGLNSFSFVDMITSSSANNLYLGIDIENDYDHSQWKDSGRMPPPGDCEGELMILIEAE